MDSLKGSGDITKWPRCPPPCQSCQRQVGNVLCPHNKTLRRYHWNWRELWAFLPTCIKRSFSKGQMWLPQPTRYLDLWNAKVLGNFKADWCLQVTKCQLASTAWICLYGVRTLHLQSRSAKISLRCSYNDFKVRQRRIIKLWRMPSLIPFPLTFLNNYLDKLSVCAQNWLKNFFSMYWYSCNIYSVPCTK